MSPVWELNLINEQVERSNIDWKNPHIDVGQPENKTKILKRAIGAH